MNFEIRKYNHFSVKVTKTLPIPFVVSIAKLHTPRSKFDNKFAELFEHAVLMKGRGETYTTKQWKKKITDAWVWNAAKHLHTHNQKHTITAQYA